jgi:arginyl-tRNA synthetase
MIQNELAKLVQAAISAAQQAEALPPFDIPAEIPIERPKQPEHGDFATPVALQLAKTARRNPRQVGEAIAAQLSQGSATNSALLDTVEVAGPGYINFRIAPGWYATQVETILAKSTHYADLNIGQGHKAQVEFVSANPTGPLTVGHGRGAVIGDTMSRIFEAAGYDVTREYYFNDGGLQMKNLAESVRLRARQQLGEKLEFPENYYVGGYIEEIAADLLAKHGPAVIERDWTFFRDAAVEVIFADIRKTLDRLGIKFDVYFNEMSFYDETKPGNVWDIVKQLRATDMAYDNEGAVWFRATTFGAEKDRVLVRSTGEPTYRLPDIAYHINKLQRGFDPVINVLGADHIAQYPDILAAVGALGHDSSRIAVITNQFVTLMRGGEQVKMSTRRATYVTLDELIDEVGADAVRYFMVSRAPATQYEFDLDLAKEQNNTNPVFYIQYMHARTAGIVDREAPKREVTYDPQADLLLLTHPAERALVTEMLRLPEMIEFCVRRREPHHLTFYALDLATAFSIFYDNCPVLKMDVEIPTPLRQARLKLVRAAQISLATVLGLLGMSAPTEM